MSTSIQSGETSKEDADETVTEDAQLEDLIWSLMSKTGFLSQIQGQVSKFIEDNGKTDDNYVSTGLTTRKTSFICHFRLCSF